MFFSYRMCVMPDSLKRAPAAVAQLPQMSGDEEQLAAALEKFKAADTELSEASAQLLQCLRSNPEKTPLVFMNGQPQWRLGALRSDAEFAQLESQCARALERRNKTLHRWSQLKVGNEGG